MKAHLSSLSTLCLLTFGWIAVGWLLGEVLMEGFGEPPPRLSAGWTETASHMGPAEGEPEPAEMQPAADAAEAAAQELLRDSPLDSTALTMLGLAAAARGEAERARELMELAVARTPADLQAQGWLFSHRLLADDRRGALAHADAMLRANPKMLERLLPPLAAVAGDGDGAAALAEQLAAAPPWRSRFLVLLAGASAEPLAPFALYSALLASSAPLSRAELQPYLARLVDSGHYEQARLLWTQTLPAEQLANARFLANGGFEEEPTGYLFDWRLEHVEGARAEIATIPDGDGGRALRVQFHDRRTAFRHVSQLLTLMPGRYRLSGRVRAEALRNERGVHWTLSCVEQPATQLAASERVNGTTRWQRFEVAFEVPSSGCRAQWLRLELAARIAAESHATGAVWYDDLALSRIGTVEEESCPHNTLPPQPLARSRTQLRTVASLNGASLASPGGGEGAQCTCAAPAETPVELLEVAGDVVIFRDEQTFAAERRAALAPGDRVMVRAGGSAVMAHGVCHFELKAQSVLTVHRDECVVCTIVASTGEAEVAYGQSGTGEAVGGFMGNPGVVPLIGLRPSPQPGIVIGLPIGDVRPPTSQ